jgi:hypothetical protein
LSAETVLIASAAGLGVVFLASAVSNIWFYLRLKKHEHEAWVSIGSPMPIVNLHLYNFAQVRKFLGERRHKDLQDSKSVGLGNLVVLTDRVFLGYIALASLSVFYIIIFVEP